VLTGQALASIEDSAVIKQLAILDKRYQKRKFPMEALIRVKYTTEENYKNRDTREIASIEALEVDDID
jgi:hypothetical protein